MLSFFEAEKRRKGTEEDILTSRFFGIVDIINRKIVLKSLLSKINIEVSDDELDNLKIKLWENYLDCIPDAVIEGDKSLIFVESKLSAPISIEQLKKEYMAGKSKNKNFYLICITKDFDYPEEILQLKTQLSTNNIRWISWQNIYTLFITLKESTKLNNTEMYLIENIMILFEYNRLRGFKGFDINKYEQILDTYDEIKLLYDELLIFIGELSSILVKDHLIPKRTGMTAFDRDGRGTRLDTPKDWLTSHFTFAFGKKEWDFETFWNAHYLFIRFLFWKPEIWVGYKLRVDQVAQKEILIKKGEELFNYLISQENIYIVFDWINENTISDIDVDIFGEDQINYSLIEFIYKVPIESIETREILSIVRDKFISLLNMVEKIDLLPKTESNEKY